MTEDNARGVGLLLLRLALGIVFIAHGIDKMGDLAGTEANFDSLGIPAPALMAPFVTVVEIGGGAMLLLGLLTPLAGVALAVNMLVAGLTAHTEGGFFVAEGGFELVMVLGLGALALAVAGPGRISVDAATGLGAKLTPWSAPRATS